MACDLGLGEQADLAMRGRRFSWECPLAISQHGGPQHSCLDAEPYWASFTDLFIFLKICFHSSPEPIEIGLRTSSQRLLTVTFFFSVTASTWMKVAFIVTGKDLLREPRDRGCFLWAHLVWVRAVLPVLALGGFVLPLWVLPAEKEPGA